MPGESSTRNLRGRKLGVLLSTAPDHPNLTTCVALGKAALDRGVELYLYLVDEGVRCAADECVRELGRRGARLFACAYGAQRRRLPMSGEATYCGLVVLADLLHGTDRFVALN